jgi:hypothetical protein
VRLWKMRLISRWQKSKLISISCQELIDSLQPMAMSDLV